MSRQDARRYVVAYDVPQDARRTRLAGVLERFGDRVQYSVFVVDLGAAALVRLRTEVEAVMVAEEDSVLLCDLGPADGVETSRFTYLGQRRRTTPRNSIIL